VTSFSSRHPCFLPFTHLKLLPAATGYSRPRPLLQDRVFLTDTPSIHEAEFPLRVYNNMETTKEASLLELPAELRLKIYRHLFRGRQLRLLLTYSADDGEHSREDVIRLLNPDDKSIDDGITLTSHKLRTESLLVLCNALSLEGCAEECFFGPGHIPVKHQYLDMIRTARFQFAEWGFRAPVHQFPS
jgi:hypothetical protein